MNKAFYIIGLILCLACTWFILYYLQKINESENGNPLLPRWMCEYERKRITREAAFLSFFFLLGFGLIFASGWIRIKRTANVIFSIIGLVGILALSVLNAVMYITPGQVNYDEGGLIILWSIPIIMSLFGIGILQTGRFENQENRQQLLRESDILDS